jgi:hypothetical protein
MIEKNVPKKDTEFDIWQEELVTKAEENQANWRLEN